MNKYMQNVKCRVSQIFSILVCLLFSINTVHAVYFMPLAESPDITSTIQMNGMLTTSTAIVAPQAWKLQVVHCGDDIIQYNRTDDLTAFTGLSVDSGYQKGNARAYASDGFFGRVQAQGRRVGFYLDNLSMPLGWVYVAGGGPHQTQVYKFRKWDNVRPWRNSSTELVLQALVKIPWHVRTGNNPEQPVAQATFLLRFQDMSSPSLPAIPVVVCFHDPRPDAEIGTLEKVSYDTSTSDPTPFVSTRLRSSSSYCTLRYGSAEQRGTFNTEKLFRVHFTGANITKIATDMNTKLPSGSDHYSTTAADYAVILGACHSEQGGNYDANGNVQFGMSYRNFSIFEYINNDPGTDLIRHYKFQDGVNDESPYRNEGMYKILNSTNNDPTNADTLFRDGCSTKTSSTARALLLDGLNRYVEIPYENSNATIGGTNAITVSGWVYSHNESQTDAPIVFKQGCVEILLDGKNIKAKLYSDVNNASVQTTAGPCLKNTWVHYAITWSSLSHSLKLYINGNYITSSTLFGGSVKLTTNKLYIGSNDNQTKKLNASVDEVRIYNTAKLLQAIIDVRSADRNE